MGMIINTAYWSLYKHYMNDHQETDIVARFYSASVLAMIFNFLFMGIMHFPLIYLKIYNVDNLNLIFSLVGWIFFNYLIFRRYKKLKFHSNEKIVSHILIFVFFFIAMGLWVVSMIISSNLFLSMKEVN